MELVFSHNQIEEIPVDENGRFCNMDDLTEFSFSFNKLKKFPNIFSSEMISAISNVDFSYNDLQDYTDEEAAAFKGIYVQTLTLAGNPGLTKYPKWLGDSDSEVSYIILRGCGLTEFPEGCFEGKYSSRLISFDLTYNRLTDLPDDFSADTLPYLYGLDLSQNAFAKFPYEPMTCKGLTVFAIRGQRDEQGERCLREWPTGVYQHTGLPPTAISNPGMSSITAALQPAETDYYYYVLGADGKHVFSETLSEHQQNVAAASAASGD